MRRNVTKGVSIALGGLLCSSSLSACSASPPPSASIESTPKDITEEIDNIGSTREVTGDIDIKNWKTTADAYAGSANTAALAFDENYFIEVVESNGRIIRVIASMTNDTYKDLEKASSKEQTPDDTYDEQMKIAQDLSLENATDITATKLTTEQLNAIIGQTGQHLLENGYRLEYPTDDEPANKQTIPMANDFFKYQITFDKPVALKDPEKRSEAVKTATVTNAEFDGLSPSATSPEAMKMVPPGSGAAS